MLDLILGFCLMQYTQGALSFYLWSPLYTIGYKCTLFLFSISRLLQHVGIYSQVNLPCYSGRVYITKHLNDCYSCKVSALFVNEGWNPPGSRRQWKRGREQLSLFNGSLLSLELATSCTWQNHYKLLVKWAHATIVLMERAWVCGSSVWEAGESIVKASSDLPGFIIPASLVLQSIFISNNCAGDTYQ